MDKKPQQYPALYVIFTLLNAVRRGIPRKNIWREFHRQGITLKPRLVFWLALCRQAGLLKEIDGSIKVTSYAHSWLKKMPEQQTFSLIEAWQTAPKNKKARQFRKKLLWKLRYNRPLTAKDHMALITTSPTEPPVLLNLRGSPGLSFVPHCTAGPQVRRPSLLLI